MIALSHSYDVECPNPTLPNKSCNKIVNKLAVDHIFYYSDHCCIVIEPVSMNMYLVCLMVLLSLHKIIHEQWYGTVI